jgi:hypothetical protein
LCCFVACLVKPVYVFAAVALLVYPKLKARRLIEEWLKSIIGYGRIVI